jgi:hypothetical protein
MAWRWRGCSAMWLSLAEGEPTGPPLLAVQDCRGVKTVWWCFPLSRQGSPPERRVESLRPLASGATGARMNCSRLRLHHISTDEVLGSLEEAGRFSGPIAYDPRSPFSASKAASDHLVNAWLDQRRGA